MTGENKLWNTPIKSIVRIKALQYNLACEFIRISFIDKGISINWNQLKYIIIRPTIGMLNDRFFNTKAIKAQFATTVNFSNDLDFKAQ